jgi:protein-tyrosine phosphatase
MDADNAREVRAMDRHHLHGKKIRRLTEFCQNHKAHEVPDPYYGGEQGFADVIDLIEDACTGLLQSISPPRP